MSYTALYRKYRPVRFADVLGQEHIVRTLKNQIVSGKVSHAYLFCGTRGTGKTSLAKIFAKAINCLSPQEGEPCGVCEMCEAISGERSLNVIEIDAASNNGVDNIRDIREEARYTPTSGKFKVYIIDEVHMLSAGAYNALLKTLEEPPEHVIFILATTDPQKIPATIHSRCQRYDFRRIPSALISERLMECLGNEGIEAEKVAAEYISRVSDGSMRDALSLLDRIVAFFEGERITLDKALEITGSMDSKSFLELTRHLNAFDAYDALLVVDSIVRSGRDISRIVAEALSHFRSLLIAKSVENPAAILDISEETAVQLKAQCADMDTARLMAYIEAFSELQSVARFSPDARVLLEIELIKLCNPEIVDKSYEELFGKVLQLEKKMESGTVSINKGETVKGRAQEAGREQQPEKPKVKIALPEDLVEVKKRFGEITKKLSEERENHFFAAVVSRAEVGFLDDKSVYLVFEDETNEGILKNEPKKMELLSRTVEAITGKSFILKTITKEQFENRRKGIEFVESSASQSDMFMKSVQDIFGDVNEEE